jgi:hypothetical protein
MAATTIATLAVVVGGSGAAQASITPPGGGGGATNCEPMTYVYASGSTITLEGWTRCANASGFQLQIGYNRVGGSTIYSGLKTCRGPLAGGTNSAEISCGIDGITGKLTDNMSGSQRWCVNTLIVMGSPTAKHEWSLAGCINH